MLWQEIAMQKFDEMYPTAGPGQTTKANLGPVAVQFREHYGRITRRMRWLARQPAT
jgi:hypothetical protein